MLAMTAMTPVMAVLTPSLVKGSWLMPARESPVCASANICTTSSTTAFVRSTVMPGMVALLVALWSATPVLFAMIDSFNWLLWVLVLWARFGCRC